MINHADFNRKPNLRDEIQFKEVRIKFKRTCNHKICKL